MTDPTVPDAHPPPAQSFARPRAGDGEDRFAPTIAERLSAAGASRYVTGAVRALSDARAIVSVATAEGRARMRDLAAVSEGGFRHLPGVIDAPEQTALVELVSVAAREAPFFRPTMPRTGQPFSVLMTNMGPFGWVADRSGYRYQPTHPETGAPWPPIPPYLQELWRTATGWPAAPECCLVNFYRDPKSRMGLHRDQDEDDLKAPVLSISLGDDALFRIGGRARGGPTRSLRLLSGDMVVLGGAARLAYHGVDRIYPGTSALIAGGGRINLTLRRVTRR